MCFNMPGSGIDPEILRETAAILGNECRRDHQRSEECVSIAIAVEPSS